MPSTSGKITKAPTAKKAATSTKRSTTSRKTASTSRTSNTATTKKATKKATTKVTPDRIGTLEEKVDKLLTILDTEFRSELRQGPKSLSNKLRNAGLIVKD